MTSECVLIIKVGILTTTTKLFSFVFKVGIRYQALQQK